MIGERLRELHGAGVSSRLTVRIKVENLGGWIMGQLTLPPPFLSKSKLID